MVFPSVLDSQNTRQRWCQVRPRVAGDDPRTYHNNDGKGVKRAEVPPAEKFPGCPGGCLSAWSSVCVSGSWSCAGLVFPGPGRWVSVSGALFPCGLYWSVDIEGVFLRWYILWFIPFPHSFVDFWQGVSTRFQPTGGGRWKNLHVQSGLSVEVYVSFIVSLSAFCFHCDVPCPTLQVCVLFALFLKLQSPWMCGSLRLSCCFPRGRSSPHRIFEFCFPVENSMDVIVSFSVAVLVRC